MAVSTSNYHCTKDESPLLWATRSLIYMFLIVDVVGHVFAIGAS